jgi:hypothetical protein
MDSNLLIGIDLHLAQEHKARQGQKPSIDFLLFSHFITEISLFLVE